MSFQLKVSAPMELHITYFVYTKFDRNVGKKYDVKDRRFVINATFGAIINCFKIIMSFRVSDSLMKQKGISPLLEEMRCHT
jgi:hypothetical protein